MQGAGTAAPSVVMLRALRAAVVPIARMSRARAVVVAAGTAALLAAGCGGDDSGGGAGTDSQSKDGGAGKGTVLVGAPIAETGFMSQFDLPAVAGAKMAIEDINKEGGLLGRKIKLTTFDTKTDKAQGAVAAQQALSAGADVILSSCDLDFGGPGAIVANKAGKLVLGCAADPRFGKQGIGENAFTFPLLAPLEGQTAAEWAYKEQGWRKVYLLVDNYIQYSKSVGRYFKAAWAGLPDTQTVGSDVFANNEASFSAQVSRLRTAADKADFIYMPTCVPGGATLLRQIRAAGITTPVVSDQCMMGDDWIKSVPGLKDYWATANLSANGDDPNQEINAFLERFLPSCKGTCPTRQYGVVGYSMIQGWAEAVRQAKSFDTAKVRAALEGFKDVPLLIGKTTFTPDLHGDLAREVMMLKVDGGGKLEATQYVKPETTPTITF